MGSYLIVNGKENNTKSISYPMINLLREILPEKKSLFDCNRFTLTKIDVATIVYNTTELLEDDDLLACYINRHSNDYGMDRDFESIKKVFEYIQRLFAKKISDIVICDNFSIICEWE